MQVQVQVQVQKLTHISHILRIFVGQSDSSNIAGFSLGSAPFESPKMGSKQQNLSMDNIHNQHHMVNLWPPKMRSFAGWLDIFHSERLSKIGF